MWGSPRHRCPGYPLAAAVVFELFTVPLLARLQGSLAVPDKGHGAGSVSRLARADAWWPIPIGHGRFAAGDHIEVLPIGTTAPPG